MKMKMTQHFGNAEYPKAPRQLAAKQAVRADRQRGPKTTNGEKSFAGEEHGIRRPKLMPEAHDVFMHLRGRAKARNTLAGLLDRWCAVFVKQVTTVNELCLGAVRHRGLPAGHRLGLKPIASE